MLFTFDTAKRDLLCFSYSCTRRWITFHLKEQRGRSWPISARQPPVPSASNFFEYGAPNHPKLFIEALNCVYNPHTDRHGQSSMLARVSGTRPAGGAVCDDRSVNRMEHPLDDPIADNHERFTCWGGDVAGCIDRYCVPVTWIVRVRWRRPFVPKEDFDNQKVT
ncbi:unnamed protein product [Peronospora belbahrii]|uniref:Uncharacterized protein n=1 Tax=Peronospora belbahrii TaxID=622444 RepID=A0AAU9LB92_9STRA|nr:unnamed protein product [Peronospora belbahrii]